MSWETLLFRARVRKPAGDLVIDYRGVGAARTSDEWAKLCRRYVLASPHLSVRRWLGITFSTFASGAWYVRLGRLFVRREGFQWAGKAGPIGWPKRART